MSEPAGNGTCFIIGPLDDPGSEIRKRSLRVCRHCIEPAARGCGFDPKWVGDESTPGTITPHIINHLWNDPMVVADISGANPNVFYELAIRHGSEKPVILVSATPDHKLPFDTAAERTVFVDSTDPDDCKRAEGEITKQIRVAQKDPTQLFNPLSLSFGLAQTGDSKDRVVLWMAAIDSKLTALLGRSDRSKLDYLRMLGAEVKQPAVEPSRAGAFEEAIRQIQSQLGSPQ